MSSHDKRGTREFVSALALEGLKEHAACSATHPANVHVHCFTFTLQVKRNEQFQKRRVNIHECKLVWSHEPSTPAPTKRTTRGSRSWYYRKGPLRYWTRVSGEGSHRTYVQSARGQLVVSDADSESFELRERPNEATNAVSWCT